MLHLLVSPALLHGSIFAGLWISTLSIHFYSSKATRFIQLYSLVPPFCMTFVLVSDFVLAKTWLIIEPKPPQLVKHLPSSKVCSQAQGSTKSQCSHILGGRHTFKNGKSRYGGPFTTEQVEDVKTILRLLPLCLTPWLPGCSLAIFHPSTSVIVYLNSQLDPIFIQAGLIHLQLLVVWCGLDYLL